MELAQLQARADQVTDRFQIERVSVEWKPEDDKTNHLGTAHLYAGRITIRRIWRGVPRTDEELEETVNHELAHFVAYRLTGDTKHGRGFKKYAKQLGAFGRARVGSIAFEQARDKKAKDAKSSRAKNRKEHAAGHEPTGDCHLCRREVFGTRSNNFQIFLR